MHEGTTAADGSFTDLPDHPLTAAGGVNSRDFDAHTVPASKYAGNPYGAPNSLEAAGWRRMVRDSRGRADQGSLVGSFGAVCVSGCG